MKLHTFNIKTTMKVFSFLSLLATATGIYADDTEVFYSANVSAPNLMFVLDVSGSMATRVPNTSALNVITVEREVSQVVSDGDDDGEQLSTSNGVTARLNGVFLEMGVALFGGGNFGEPQFVGYRFSEVDIPPNAEITDAYIQFETATISLPAQTQAPAQLQIVVESADDPVTFTSDQNSGNRITDRLYGVDVVEWDPPVWTTVNEQGLDQRTPDLSILVQSLVDRSNWNNNNAMVFVVEGRQGNQGTRVVSSANRADRRQASLHIEYREIQQGGDLTRLEVMQRALRQVLNEAPDNINVGLMNYGEHSLATNNPENRRLHGVSGVVFPATDINSKAIDVIPSSAELFGLPSVPDPTTTVREYIADIADSWTPSSFTPTVGAIYEAALYLRGETVHYGQHISIDSGAHPSTYEGNPITSNVFGSEGRVRADAPKYISPIESSCQNSYIAVMTDGSPTYVANGGRSFTSGPLSRKNTISVGGPQGPLADAINNCATSAGGFIGGLCGAELTNHLATTDNIADSSATNRDGLDDEQLIDTFTIGFATGTGGAQERFLQSLATYDDLDPTTPLDNPGGPDGYFEAESPEELANAFRNIFAAVVAPRGTLASPGYSVNVRSGLENERDVFIPVFDRGNSSRWSGNLKKFRIEDVGGSRVIQGSNGLNATTADGNFTPEALDFWSTSATPDGDEVEAGGVANLLVNPATRRIVSNLTSDSNVFLTTPGNLLTTDNIAILDNSTSTNIISNTLLGLPDDATLALRTQLINFMRGFVNGDENGGARKYVGDMLHTEPVVITYNSGDGTVGSREQYVFASTNEGYLHAFDSDTGEEKFAFIPKELLKLADPLFRNSGSEIDHEYGIDGILNFQFKGGRDGTLDAGAGDKIILYFGLRRGGSSYYALDVTDIDNPKLLWTKSAADYPSMGQSWSRPYLRKIGQTGSTCADNQADCRDVVIISGGYDGGIGGVDGNGGGPDGISEDRDLPGGNKLVDDSTAPITADVGNDILILDAQSGDLVWSMPQSMRSQITNSIPGGLRAVDSNQNNLIDRMYFADTGGNVWRLDFTEALGSPVTAANVLTKLADLGGNGSNSRKFYNEPEVSSLRVDGKSIYTVSVGSGFRAHPLDVAIVDKFYILVDEAPFTRLSTSTGNGFTTITESNLASISINGSTATTTGSISDVNKRGWMINFSQTGEKILSQAFTFEGQIAFSTLVPEPTLQTAGFDQCAVPISQSNTYFFNLITGDLIERINNSESPGIANVIQPFFNAPDIIANVTDQPISQDGTTIDPATGQVIRACVQDVDLRKGTNSAEISGFDSCKLESVYWSDPIIR